jgi:uncharacterized protein YdaU (DUF1376 family)
MGKDPAFLMYSKDWISGTSAMMPDEKGVYIDFLCYQHQHGGLPLDSVRLAKIVGLPHDEFMRIWSVVGIKFNQMGDQLVNQKLNEVIEERAIRGRKNRISGTFASVLKGFKDKYDKQTIARIRSKFKAELFLDVPDVCLEDDIYNWCTKWCTN